MIIILYTQLNQNTIATCTGLPEAERYHAFQRLLPLLKKYGEIRLIESPAFDVDSVFDEAQTEGRSCVFLSFTPPHLLTVGLKCPTIAVFDWAYDTVPDQTREGDPRHNWRWVFEQIAGVITHSASAAEVLRNAAPENFPIAVAPLPVWDRCHNYRSNAVSAFKQVSPKLNSAVIDTQCFKLNELAPVYFQQHQNAIIIRNDSVLSRTQSLLRSLFNTTVYAGSAVRTVRQTCSTNLLCESPLKTWREAIISRYTLSARQISAGKLSLKGVIYTAILNPFDPRSLFHDTVTAFCKALGTQSDAILIVSLFHRDLQSVLHKYVYELYKLQPFSCRVILCFDELDQHSRELLIKASTYIVHVSRGEGQCLPLMEFMSAGKPAIAQPITAMRDYINADTGFPFESGWEITWWPHDPQSALCARHARVNWETLLLAYKHSYTIACESPESYTRLCINAARQMKILCSAEVVDNSLRDFFKSPRLYKQVHESHAFAATYQPAQTTAADPRAVGLVDAFRNGWFNRAKGELCKDFTIRPEDIVFDLGCGDGSATLFAASIGAHVIFSDTDSAKMENLVRQVRQSIAASYRALVADAAEIALPEKSVSRVIAMEVLEHLETPQQTLAELVRIGKRGALYLLTVPEEKSERVQQALAPAAHFEAPNHIQIFSSSAFETMIRTAGLIIESRQSAGFYWALWFSFYWAAQQTDNHAYDLDNTIPTLDQIQPPYPELLLSWARTWQLLIDLPEGDRVRKALDEFMPKTRVIIARKP